ncbi:MAG: helix-turn-helix transcriptional regulator [Proteobacteria bacterium]|nr:helix-turn-helix transcriptional regulator [Candidatus Enterousia scatequi]
MANTNVTPAEVDQYVGRRIQLRRTMLGMSQKDLATQCGVTFQQIQKYEAADNRISASRLFFIGLAMDTSVGFFFKGLPGNLPEETKANMSLRVSEPKIDDDPFAKNDSLELLKLYWRLPSDEQRKIIMDLLTSMSANQS